MTKMNMTCFVLLGIIAFSSCKKNDDDSTDVLSPARSLQGTWKTTSSVNFFYLTDKCGGFVRYAEQLQKITWTITSTSDNEVSIYNATDYKGPISIYNICSQQPVPVSYVVASVMRGVISSSQMDLYVGSDLVGSMSFTTNNLTGTYDRKICDTYGCTGLNTDEKTLILTKQ